jgi:hypothetical protein
MRFLRILVAGLIAVFAMGAIFLTAVVVFLAGLFAFVIQLFRGKVTGSIRMGRPAGPDRPAASRPEVRRMDDVIDVDSVRIPPEH